MSSGDSGRITRIRGSCDRCHSAVLFSVFCSNRVADQYKGDKVALGGGTCSNCLAVNAHCAHTRQKMPRSDPKGSIQNIKTAKQHVSKILSTPNCYSSSNSPALLAILNEVAQYARALEEQLASLQEQLLQTAANTPLSGIESDVTTPQSPPGDTPVDAFLKDPDVTLVRTNRSLQFVQAVIKNWPGHAQPMLGLPWKRAEFWARKPWEPLVTEPPKPSSPLTFPPPDLLASLITLYFTKCNPLLASFIHEPSFRAAVFSERRHLSETNPSTRDRFGCVVLAVCALASRYSDDPRVLLEGSAEDEHSCGWRWFRQVRSAATQAVFWPGKDGTLYQLQLICLAISFLTSGGMTTREEPWTLAGLGLRFAEAAGVHRRSAPGYDALSPVEAEQYRRAVWLLTLSDSLIRAFRGRQRASVGRLALVLDLPLDCDDVHWGKDPPLRVQPDGGRPSQSTYTLQYIKLVKIVERVQETVYPQNGATVVEDDIIALDSQLNEWLENLPDHLKWNVNLEDPIFLYQSASLHAAYYHTQILMHRVFITAPGKARSLLNRPKLSFPSLAICSNAARSCVRIIEEHTRRGDGLIHLTSLTRILSDSATILLLGAAAQRKLKKIPMQTEEEFDRATADVGVCLDVLRKYETRWRFAGLRYDAVSAGLRLLRFTTMAAKTRTPSPAGGHVDGDTSSPYTSRLPRESTGHQLLPQQLPHAQSAEPSTFPAYALESAGFVPQSTSMSMNGDGNCDWNLSGPEQLSNDTMDLDLETLFGDASTGGGGGFSPDNWFTNGEFGFGMGGTGEMNSEAENGWADWSSYLMDFS
ncbi:hypothetical protein MKEN_00946000 [Mycena kentingensis (nom. inval.)]|nr:hypothetical protein MKEN_00946000 [Mycena kentingensis (nom. inval.)]